MAVIAARMAAPRPVLLQPRDLALCWWGGAVRVLDTPCGFALVPALVGPCSRSWRLSHGAAAIRWEDAGGPGRLTYSGRWKLGATGSWPCKNILGTAANLASTASLCRPAIGVWKDSLARAGNLAACAVRGFCHGLRAWLGRSTICSGGPAARRHGPNGLHGWVAGWLGLARWIAGTRLDATLDPIAPRAYAEGWVLVS